MLKRSMAVLALLLGSIVSARAQSDVPYRAETAGPVKITGAVFAAKVRWDCDATTCKTSAPAGLNQIEMCRDLARQVGPLKTYQHGDALLDDAQLQQCNAATVAAVPQLQKVPAVAPIQVRPKVLPAAAPVSPVRPVTPSKQTMFKPPEYWKQQYSIRLQNAPKPVADAIIQKNAALKASGKSFTVGVTSTQDRPLSAITGFKMPARPADFPTPSPAMQALDRQTNCTMPTVSATDRHVDMRDLSVITAIRDQYPCGGCWAFATLAALETSILLKNGGDARALQLSQPQMLKCAFTVPGGCAGGLQASAAGYATDHPIVTAAEWGPFADWYGAGQPNRCDSFSNSNSPYKVRRWGYASGDAGVLNPSPSREAMKRAIVDYGSVAASLQATDTFKAYAGGVYDMNDNTTLIPNHVIQIIGWDDGLQAWLIKNSWGEGWGEGGFGWVRYDTNLIGAYAVWVEADVTPGSLCATNSPDFQRAGAGPFPFYQRHHLQNRQSGLLVEVNDALIGPDRGRKVQQYHNHGPSIVGDAHNQAWWFMFAGLVDGRPSYRILNEGFDNFLSEYEGKVVALPGSGNNTQRWLIEQSGGPESYVIRNVQSGNVLQVPAGNRSDEAAVAPAAFSGAENQLFVIARYGAVSGMDDKRDAPVYLVPVHAGAMALDRTAGAESNGTPLQLWQRMEHNGNQFFMVIWNDATQAFNIIEKGTVVKCLDVRGGSTRDGAVTELQDCTNRDSQGWYFVPVAREGGHFMIFNKNSGKSLEALGVGTSNGTPVGQWEFVNGPNQKWELRDWK